jgi:mono/diheme cytochrome c family protein
LRRRAVLPLLALLGAAGTHSALAAHDPGLDYMLQCQGCHGADGAGTPGAVPELRGSVGRFLRVPGGREYLIRVPGSAQSALGDAELAEVLNWIIRRFGPADVAAGFEPFAADEIARHRKQPLVDVEPVRRELLRQLETTHAAPRKP